MYAKKVLVVAGEASGDMHAAALVKALRSLNPDMRFYGVGGQKLRENGVEIIADAADMAVVGMTEVFLKLPFILKVMKKLKDSFIKEKPDLALLVDYPDFNLVLAKAAHRLGIKVFYYISPQVWAWRNGRIRKIKQYVDKMAVILPFEVPLYQSRGVDVSFVGHPLLDIASDRTEKEVARKRLGLRAGVMTVGILPGSRDSEVLRLLPLCMKAAETLNRKCEIQYVLPLANTLSRTFVEGIIKDYPVQISVISDRIYDALRASDLAIAASGTATLEAALMETPMIIIYKVSWLSYLIGRIFIRVRNIGLVNIIAGKTIVPELIQGKANPQRLAELAHDLLFNQAQRKSMEGELGKIREKLGSSGAAERAARLVYDML